jgi:two-component system CheB/CheR fusion protein
MSDRESRSLPAGEEVDRQSAKLAAELDARTKDFRRANEMLAQANAVSAELVAELQARREELEWASTNLRQADEERKRILSVAAHDLRAGIGGIGEAVRVLEVSATGLGGEAAEHLALLRAECARLLDLLEGMLEDAQGDFDRLVIQTVPSDLATAVRDVIRFHEDRAHAKSQLLTGDLPERVVVVEADGLRLRQVLDNLVSNAIKYCPPSTRILVRLRETEQETAVSVIDEGPGLTEEDLGKVFGEFCRLSAKPTGGEESHGLGLAIARRIVEAHGGRIWAQNRADRSGAHFGFAIPRTRGRIAALNILVVDDGAVNRSIAKKFLEKDGHTVDLAGDGREAVELVRERSYDIVLMDVEMQGMSGTDATREIRASEATDKRVPVIALTAHADKESRDECLRAGMDDVVVKPFDPKTLRLTVSRWVRRF